MPFWRSGRAFDMNAIQAALGEVVEFYGAKMDQSIIEKFICRITPINNGCYRWDLNFAPGKKQPIIG
jgi:hypothetical protein